MIYWIIYELLDPQTFICNSHMKFIFDIPNVNILQRALVAFECIEPAAKKALEVNTPAV